MKTRLISFLVALLASSSTVAQPLTTQPSVLDLLANCPSPRLYLGTATSPICSNISLPNPASIVQLILTGGKTITLSNTMTITATDGATLAIGAGGTLGSNAYTSTAYAPIANPTFTGTVTIPNGGVFGIPTSLTLTNGTGLPIGTGLTGAGTGVLAALAVNVGSAGAVVTFNGAIGTPSSGVGTNITGVNAATLGGATFAAPGAIGGGTPSAGTFTTLTASTSLTSQLYIGGTGTTSTLTLQPTSGAGTTGANILFKGGNNGATTWGIWQDGGFLTLGASASTSDLLNVNGAANQGISVLNGSGSVKAFLRWNTGAGGYIGVLDTASVGSTQILGTGDSYIAAPSGGASLGVNTQVALPAAQTGNTKYLTMNGPIQHAKNTVANLPTCNAAAEGARYGVTDAAAVPVYNAIAASGGTVHIAVYCNGTNWVNQ